MRAAAWNAPPLLSIAVPCFHQLELAARCLEGFLSQSFGEFELTVLDDGKSADYRRYIESIGDPRLHYRANEARLGAMSNMFQAAFFGTGKYSMAFHEDDLPGKHYLDAAVSFLEAHPRCGFVGAELRFFEETPGRRELDYRPITPRFDSFETREDFLRSIFRGVEPMFGSVVYRREALKGICPRVDELGTLCDRPFLLEILGSWSGALARDPLVFCRLHQEGDGRHDSLTPAQVLGLLGTYRRSFPPKMTAEDRNLFFAYTARWLPELHRLIPEKRRPRLSWLLLRAWLLRLYDPWRGGVGTVARRALRLLRT